MKTTTAFLAIALASFSAPVAAQDFAPPAIPPAPVGHLQPRPAAPPERRAEDSAGAADKDDPARLDQRLQASDDAAIRSICSDCLKRRPPAGRP